MKIPLLTDDGRKAMVLQGAPLPPSGPFPVPREGSLRDRLLKDIMGQTRTVERDEAGTFQETDDGPVFQLNPGYGYDWLTTGGFFHDYTRAEAEAIVDQQIADNLKDYLPQLLNDERSRLFAEIKSRRDELLARGGRFDGREFSVTEQSTKRLNEAQETIEGAARLEIDWPGMLWLDADGVGYPIPDAETFKTFTATLGLQAAAIFGSWAMHRSAINALTDLAALKSYDMDQGWP